MYMRYIYPFLVQPYLSRYPPDQRESIFVVVPLALSPSFPPGLGTVDLLTAVMDPLHVHPPPSYAILVVHSRLSLNRHIAVIKRSLTTPRHGRGHGPRLPWLLTTGPRCVTCGICIQNNSMLVNCCHFYIFIGMYMIWRLHDSKFGMNRLEANRIQRRFNIN